MRWPVSAPAPLRALALLLWALALIGAGAGFAVGGAVYDRGVVYGDPGPAIPDLDGPPRGINTQLEVEPDEAAQRRSLQLIRAAGFGWIRQQFSWAAVEGGGKGQFVDSSTGRSTWEPYDQIVRIAREEGLQVIARIDLPPAWARPPGSTKTHPPVDVRDYGDFVAAFVERYQDQVDHIQLWNEPNLVAEWGDQPVDAAAYVELLKAGYLGAKGVAPNVRVLSGMLAPTLEPDHPGARGLDDLLYLDRMYLYGARPYFDILAGNAYGLHTGPEDRQVGPSYTNFPRLLLVRQVMLRHGDTGKAVWVTEFGWNALPPGWAGDPSPWGKVNPQQQASYIVGAYARAGQEWPWLGPLNLWLFRQPRPDPRDPTAYFGLVDPDWRLRPSYEALRATAPADARPTLGPGVHQESSAGLDFGGTWQWTPDPAASLGALRESPISGASLRFRFRGTGLALLAPTGPTRGTAYVKINGASTLANRLPLNANGQATLDFYALTAVAQRRLLIADGLPDREHQVEITVTGQPGPGSAGPGVGVDAIVVARARPLAPMALLAGAGAGTVLAGLWAGRARPRAIAGAGRRAVARFAAGPRQFSTAGGPVAALPAPATPAVRRGPGPAPFVLHQLLPLPRSAYVAYAARATYTADSGRPVAVAAALGALAVEAIRRSVAFALTFPWRKALALAVAASLPLAPLAVRTPAGRFSPVELLLLAYVGLNLIWLYFDGLDGLSVWRQAGFVGPAILVIAAGAVSLVVADYPHLALREWRTVVLGPAVYYCLARAALRRREDALALAGAFLAGAAGAAVLAIGQVVLGRGLVAAEGVGRARALYPSPNNLALLLDRAIPVGLALSLTRRGRLPRAWPATLVAVRVATALCALALFFTFSRGAWLAVAVAGACLLAPSLRRLRRIPAARSRRLLLWGLAAGTPVLVAGAALALRVERFRSLFARDGTAFLRLRLWQSASEMVRDHPLWGIGLDQFLYLYPRYMHPDAWREPNLSHPHNLILDFWLRLGILGLLALGWATWNVARRVRRHDAGAGPLVWGATGALIAVVVHGLLDNSFFVIDLAYGCWVLLLVVELAGEPDPSAVAVPNAGPDLPVGPALPIPPLPIPPHQPSQSSRSNRPAWPTAPTAAGSPVTCT